MKVLKNFLLQNKGIVALTSSFIVLQIIGILGVPMLVAPANQSWHFKK